MTQNCLNFDLCNRLQEWCNRIPVKRFPKNIEKTHLFTLNWKNERFLIELDFQNLSKYCWSNSYKLLRIILWTSIVVSSSSLWIYHIPSKRGLKLVSQKILRLNSLLINYWCHLFNTIYNNFLKIKIKIKNKMKFKIQNKMQI